MKEITRIHIAKVPYDIEVSARKSLEKYMASLEAYAAEPDVYEEIEVRVTELLGERGVVEGGVIGEEDVRAVRDQLGEPEEFAQVEDDMVAGVVTGDTARRRLYRNQEQAVLGGVLAGIATYFNMNPLWIRLAFIVLLFISFGSLLFVYAVLWIATPAARTAAERLQLEGRPVTLAAIKEQSERYIDGSIINPTAARVQKILFFCIGLGFSLIALVAFVAVMVVGIGFTFGIGTSDTSPLKELVSGEVWQYQVGIVLGILSGLLFVSLNIIIATAAFRRVWTKRISAVVVCIILTGLVLFGTGVASVFYGEADQQRKAYDSREVSTVDLPANFKYVRTLDLSSDERIAQTIRINYVVSSDYRFTLEATPGVMKPVFMVADDSKSADVSLELVGSGRVDDLSALMRPTLTIYGPALSTLNLGANTNIHYYNKDSQRSLAVYLHAATFELDGGGMYEAVEVSTMGESTVSLQEAAIRHLAVDNQSGYIEAGVVKDLTVTQPDACSSSTGSNQNYVHAQGVSSKEMVYNGKKRFVDESSVVKSLCANVIIGEQKE